MEISGIKGYNILITCDNKIHADDPHKTKEKKFEDQFPYLRTWNAEEERHLFNNSYLKRFLEGICLGYLCK